MEIPYFTKYLKPCKEVFTKYSRIVPISNFANKKSLELFELDVAMADETVRVMESYYSNCEVLL